MTTGEALLLGLVQGATEFLPISSSGHLVITEALLGISEGGLLVEITLHAGTLLAVLLYFRKRIAWILMEGFRRGSDGPQARSWMIWLIVATLPAAFIGLMFRDGIERQFESPSAALIGLLLTGLILFSTKWSGQRSRKPNGLAGLWMGCAQALAIMPGISRSGSTIAMGMWSGVDKADAAEFSFLLSVVAISGASLLQAVEITGGTMQPASGMMVRLLAGFVMASVSGYAAIALLIGILKKRGLVPFAWYCWAVGIAGLLLVSL
ncbi:undecaprenyl-diphosphate phosphatase [Gemmatimonadota bacterium]